MLAEDFKNLKPGVRLVFKGGKPLEGRYFFRGNSYTVDTADEGVVECIKEEGVVAIRDKDGIKRYFLYASAAGNFCSEREWFQETQKEAKSKYNINLGFSLGGADELTDVPHKETDWEQRRYEIAKEVSTFFLHRKKNCYDKYSDYLEASAREAVEYADALIKILGK